MKVSASWSFPTAQVASFTGERSAIARYNGSLKKAYDSGVQEGLATGFGFGVIMFIVLCTYSLALWFGGKMVIEKGYTGGDVMNIIFSVLIGSMYVSVIHGWILSVKENCPGFVFLPEKKAFKSLFFNSFRKKQ